MILYSFSKYLVLIKICSKDYKSTSSNSLLLKSRAFNNAGSHKNTGIVHWQSLSHRLSKNDKVKKKEEKKKGCDTFKLNHQRIVYIKIYIYIEYVICYKARVQLLHISLAARANQPTLTSSSSLYNSRHSDKQQRQDVQQR